MLLSTSATRSLLTLAHTLVRKYGDGGVTRGIYIYNIQKQIYIYIYRCECYEEAHGHEGPRRATKAQEPRIRTMATKAHEGPRRPRNHEFGRSRGSAEGGRERRERSANAGSPRRAGPVPQNSAPKPLARERPRTPRTPRLEGLGAGAGAGAGGGWGWGWGWAWSWGWGWGWGWGWLGLGLGLGLRLELELGLGLGLEGGVGVGALTLQTEGAASGVCLDDAGILAIEQMEGGTC